MTTGAEGFFKAGTPYTQYNPFGTPNNVQPGWAGHIGQDTPTQHASPNIDFVVMHLCASIGLTSPTVYFATRMPCLANLVKFGMQEVCTHTQLLSIHECLVSSMLISSISVYEWLHELEISLQVAGQLEHIG